MALLQWLSFSLFLWMAARSSGNDPHTYSLVRCMVESVAYVSILVYIRSK